jgi:two-component system NarL family sensor kinase
MPSRRTGRPSGTNTSPRRTAEAASTELATLTALAQALSGPADLTQSLEAALGTVADALGLETGWVWLLDDAGEPRLAAARALPPALRDHPDAMHGDCYCLKKFRAGDLRGAANVNVVWCSRLAVLIDDDRGDEVGRLQCHASVPLVIGDRRLGMLNVASRDWRVLSEAELSLLTTAGALVSLTVERGRLEAAGARAVAAEERNRLAREIHDTIAQGLAALTMQLETADALIGAGQAVDARLGSTVSRALTLARATLDEARGSVLDLREAPLDGRSLREALDVIAADARASGNVAFAVEVTATRAAARSPPPAIERALFGIAQQAVANAQKELDPAIAVAFALPGFYADMSLFIFWLNFANGGKYKRAFEDYVRKELSGDGGPEVAERIFADVFAMKDLEQTVDEFQQQVVEGKLKFEDRDFQVEQ